MATGTYGKTAVDGACLVVVYLKDDDVDGLTCDIRGINFQQHMFLLTVCDFTRSKLLKMRS